MTIHHATSNRTVNLKLVPFLHTVSATSAFACGLLFLRFWRETGHRLFVFFGAALSLVALGWSLLALGNPDDEMRPVIYTIRLLANVLLIAGMITKKSQ